MTPVAPPPPPPRDSGNSLDDLIARARATIARTNAAGDTTHPPPAPDASTQEVTAPRDLIVMGIDPGLATTGYGVVAGSVQGNGAYLSLAYGTIETPAGLSMPSRLGEIHARATSLLRDYRPAVIAIERLFFGANATTAMAVGQARGVLLLAAAQAGIPIVEYTPLEVKSALSGFGRAPKSQMQRMVQALLSLDSLPRPDDAADGLAIALAHLRLAPTREARSAAGSLASER